MTKTDERIMLEQLARREVPEHLREGLVDYVLRGCPTGSFLKAFLSNDLMEALWRADECSLHALWEIACWLHNDVPSCCFGTPERYVAWVKKGGLANENI